MNKQTKQLLNENNTLAKQLKENYSSVLTDIVVYIRSANISEYQQEVVRRDITQIMVDGTRRGDSPENIIGEDYKVFCDNVLGELPKIKTTHKIITFVRTAFCCLALLITIRFCFVLIDLFLGETTWPYFPVTTGDLINIGLIICFSIAWVQALCKNAFNASSNNKLILSLVVMMLVSIFINLFLNKALFTVHGVVVIVSAFVLFIVSKLIDQRVLL